MFHPYETKHGTYDTYDTYDTQRTYDTHGTCNIHGDFELFHILMPSSLKCPICTTVKSMERIVKACDSSEYISIHWRDSIRCIDEYNYRTVRELIPDRCGICENGMKFMIRYDDPSRFYPIPKPYDKNDITNFEDEVHKNHAYMNFVCDNNYSLLRISFEEADNLEYWIQHFLESINKTNLQTFMCSNETKYTTLQKHSEYHLRQERKLYFH